MSDDPNGDKLGQMAEHRGLKLVKSRRRKPGVGDYGMFGLTDATGKALLGISADGLTATAADIETYLRAGALGTWQESADATPDKPKLPKSRSPEPDAPARNKPRTRPTPPPAPKVEPAPELELVIRAAKPSDAGALAKLLNHLEGITLDADSARQNLTAVQQDGGGMLLAELGEPIGCCGWAIVRTVHRGLVGRITALFIAPDHRRRGIATQLISNAEQALADQGCSIVEAMSDIQIENAHNFFRSLKFDQTSYRFTRKSAKAT